MSIIENIVNTLEKILWDSNLLAVLLVGTGIWFTFNLGFVQVKGFAKSFKMTIGGILKKSDKAGKEGMSSFQALATAIAAQVGTGNIVGASTAIAVGGAGAIFWMWIAAFFGMATIFVEATLAQKYKIVGADGHITGGPVYYIKAAFKGTFGKVLASIFAVLIILSLGFMGNAVQSNGIATAFNTAFHIPVYVVGIALAILAFLVFAGGISRIASFTEKTVPFMAVIFIIGSLFVIIMNIKAVPQIFHDIFVGAFNPKAVMGGALGTTMKLAISKGVARGLFSNEAGMGSTPHAHAVAKVAKPSDQGYVAMMGVFIDTFIILNLTAFVVIGSGVLYTNVDGNVVYSGLTGAALAQAGFSSVMGSFGNIFIAICLFFFAFSTIIGWYFFGEANVKYLFGPKAVKVYAIIVVICVFLGSLGEVQLVWNMQDMMNGLMVIPNLLGILALTFVVKKQMKIDQNL